MMQDPSMIKPSCEQKPTKDLDNDNDFEAKDDLWIPLNCLVEAANRTMSSKPSSQGITTAN